MPGSPEVTLQLLGPCRYAGTALTGERTLALLAALALADGRAVPDEQLIEQVWGSDRPAKAGKALQVLVSRTRSQTDHDLLERVGSGYRLALPVEAVDVWLVAELLAEAGRAERLGDVAAADRQARRAHQLLAELPSRPAGTTDDDGPLGRWAREQSDRCVRLLGRCASVTGAHPEALALLEPLTLLDTPSAADEPTLLALLRSQAAVHGPATALEHYERHRRALRDQLGIDPGPALQALHAELLAADRPVRSGLVHDATPLLGRDDDLAALRALTDRARVVSVVGPGGIGKTRLANLVARLADRPVVHVVELVGITRGDDVVAGVAEQLGVREGTGTAAILTARERRDLRSRTADQLGQAPTLLVLDNCEHLVDAVADLVAFLVATVPTVTVLTTSRTPLAIAAERVYPLRPLATPDALELFTQRARAARPDVDLPAEPVGQVLARLDGLPLAIELAAAKVRVMSVTDIADRLSDRFALLRGGDRSAPDRHQTLLAVIDWSWNLLTDADQRALRWLALFQDGFTLTAAEAVLGPAGFDAVRSLVDQSLLGLSETDGVVRYRMLETVREFALLRLRQASDQAEAAHALTGWGTAYARRVTARLYSTEQAQALDELRAEEHNLAQLLRQAVTERDRDATVVLAAALASLWTITNEHTRLLGLAAPVTAALDQWDPPADVVESALLAACLLGVTEILTATGHTEPNFEFVARYADRSRDPQTIALTRLLGAYIPNDPQASAAALNALNEHPDRATAALALLWSSHLLENEGSLEAATDRAVRALGLWRPQDGAWSRAALLVQLAALNAQRGRLADGAAWAGQAIPLLDRLGATDEAAGARLILVGAALTDGRLAQAQDLLDEVAELGTPRPESDFLAQLAQADLAIARGDLAGGLAQYRALAASGPDAGPPALVRREAGTDARPGPGPAFSSESVPQFAPQAGSQFSSESDSQLAPQTGPAADGRFGPESGRAIRVPWQLFTRAAAVAAYAVHDESGGGGDLYTALLPTAEQVLGPEQVWLDYPMMGLGVFALGAWGLRNRPDRLGQALELLAIAHRFGYHQIVPTLSWAAVQRRADEVAPGELARLMAACADQPGPQLQARARALVQQWAQESGATESR